MNGGIVVIDMLLDVVEGVGKLLVFFDSGICLGMDMVKVFVMGVMVIGFGCFFIYGFVFDGVVGVVYVMKCIFVEVDFMMVVNGYFLIVVLCEEGVCWVWRYLVIIVFIF